MDISERVKLIRAEKSQDSFAQELGVSKMTVGRWERGERKPDFDDLNRILEVYPGINPAWLLTGEGEMKRGEGKTVVSLQNGADLQNRAGQTFAERLKYIHSLSNEKLSDDSGISIERIIEFLSGSTMPTDKEFKQLGNALCVNPRWLSMGNAAFPLNEVGLDEDLLSAILAAIEIVADDLGREDDIISVSDRIMLAITTYNLYCGKEERYCVTVDNMVSTVMNSYYMRVSLNKITNLRSKMQQFEPELSLKAIDWWLYMRKHLDETSEEEVKKNKVELEDQTL